jgi:hypothetical protein
VLAGRKHQRFFAIPADAERRPAVDLELRVTVGLGPYAPAGISVGLWSS